MIVAIIVNLCRDIPAGVTLPPHHPPSSRWLTGLTAPLLLNLVDTAVEGWLCHHRTSGLFSEQKRDTPIRCNSFHLPVLCNKLSTPLRPEEKEKTWIGGLCFRWVHQTKHILVVTVEIETSRVSSSQDGAIETRDFSGCGTITFDPGWMLIFWW